MTWDELKKDITSLSPEDWTEIDFKVKIIGEILKARQEENVTQRALEELSGVKQPVIARIESGDTDPQISTVLRILRPLGKTLAVVPLEVDAHTVPKKSNRDEERLP